ncbi:cytochrome P450 [Chiua virens]|nr:cytochrome P450 [Chiua virens]
MLSINREAPWKTYTEWHTIYGDMFYFRLLDQDTVVLGSRTAAVELLEKRSRIYSDRPFVATLAPYGIDTNFVFTPYGDNWRSCRRIVHQTFCAKGSLALRPMQLRKGLELAVSLVQNPDRFEYHYTVFSAAESLSAVYDYDPKAEGDPLINDIITGAAAAIPAATPENAVILKLFPFLLHIPDWCPGSGLKREAKLSYDLAVGTAEMSFRYIEERMKESKQPIVSLVSNHLSQIDKYADPSNHAEYVSVLKKAAVSSLFASSETTASSLMVFTLAMVMYPHVWKRAQVEIDTVVGTDRIPNFDDRSVLPYVDAIVHETVRWRPVVPLGIWHATSDSDVYNGQYIPKGATVVANLWAMSRDEKQYPNPEEFIPERFLDDDGMLNNNINNPMDFVFGFGRRVCPGRYFADASLFTAIATMLAMFEFHIPKDEQGNDVALDITWVNGVTHHPKSFPCRIFPRSHVNKAYLERLHSKL